MKRTLTTNTQNSDRSRTQAVLQEGGAFIALATALVSLIGIPLLASSGYGFVGMILGAALALACVGVLYDRLRNYPGSRETSSDE
jgi:hypothetical protein